jgi:hypothetical protein
MLTISFTSTSNRINKIRPMVESLRSQVLQPDQINIYLTKEVVVPKFLLDLGIAVNRIDSPDWGPATKLIPFLLSNPDPDTQVITVDDDVIYDKYLISELVNASYKHPDKVLCRMGVQNGNFIHQEFLSDFQSVDVVGGYRGVLYKPKFFDTKELLEDYNKTTINNMICSDDHLFSYYLNNKNIPRLVIPYPRNRIPQNQVIQCIQRTFMNLDSGIQGNPRGNSAHIIENYYRKDTWFKFH